LKLKLKEIKKEKSEFFSFFYTKIALLFMVGITIIKKEVGY